MSSFELAQPQTIEEALALLDDDDPAIRPFGGGTALILMMKAQVYRPQRLVSLHRIGGQLRGIDFLPDRNALRIGAMTRFSELEHSPDIRQHLPVVAQALRTVANVRVRNVASVGGNLAHADPHLDLPPIWFALDAEATVVNRNGSVRTLPVAELYAGYYETTLANSDLITELSVPVRAGWKSKYVKVTTRAAHDWPALGLAISAQLTGRSVGDLRIVLSAAIDCPVRLHAAEAVLRNAEISDAVLRQAGDAASSEVEIETDSRGAGDYKQHLLRVYLRRAFEALVAE